jgi:hypothetical protein
VLPRDYDYTEEMFDDDSLSVIEWYLGHGVIDDIRPGLWSAAACRGSWRTLRWLLHLNVPRDPKAPLKAARAGRLDVLQWLLTKAGHRIVNQAKDEAASCVNNRDNGHGGEGGDGHGHLGYKRDGQGDEESNAANGSKLCSYAARAGHLGMLRWLRSRGAAWDATTCIAAAEESRVPLLKWARAHGAPWDARVFKRAVQNGDPMVMATLYEMGAPWDGRACKVAAARGCLETLRWLRNKGCPWDDRVMVAATVRQHLAILEWAYAHG